MKQWLLRLFRLDRQSVSQSSGNCTNGRIITPEEAKDMLITIALANADGDRQKAAKELGMGVKTLRRKIAERRREDKVSND